MLALRTVLRDVLSSGSSLGQCSSSSSSAGALVVASFRVFSAAAAQGEATGSDVQLAGHRVNGREGSAVVRRRRQPLAAGCLGWLS